MQAVSVQTTQNIQLDYPLAGLGDRLLAFFIDLAIILGYLFFATLIFSELLSFKSIAISTLVFIPAFIYRLLAEIFFNGQTVGKTAVNIKVIKLDGSTPSVGAYILRWLLEPADFLITGMAVVVIILTQDGQRLGDLLAGTTVIKMKKISTTNVRNKMVMKAVDENYEPVFQEAAHLSDQEIRLIKSALKAFREDAAKRPINLLEIKMKEKYSIQSELTTVEFLYTLIRDHTYYVSR